MCKLKDGTYVPSCIVEMNIKKLNALLNSKDVNYVNAFMELINFNTHTDYKFILKSSTDILQSQALLNSDLKLNPFIEKIINTYVKYNNSSFTIEEPKELLSSKL